MKSGQCASARHVLLTTAAHRKITSCSTALLEKACSVFQKTRVAPAGIVRLQYAEELGVLKLIMISV